MTDADDLLAYVDQVERVWIRLGIEPAIRRRLVVELEGDLAAARDAGAPVEDLVSTDPVTFAVELARGCDAPLLAPPPEPTRTGVITTAILGGIAGALFAWVFIETGPIGNLVLGHGPGLREQYAWIPLQSLAVLVTLAGIASAVWWRFRDTPNASMLALRTTGLALVGGILATAPLLGYAWTTNYNTAPYALVLGALIGATILAAVIRLGTTPAPRASPALKTPTILTGTRSAHPTAQDASHAEPPHNTMARRADCTATRTRRALGRPSPSVGVIQCHRSVTA